MEAAIDSESIDPWSCINWSLVSDRVNKLQSRITKAVMREKYYLVKRLQHLPKNSFFAKLIAVRKVTTNKGKNTSGIDRELWRTPKRKWEAALSLESRGYRSLPLRRKYIEKKGKKKKRPLGIPTKYDRAMQALYALTLDPVAEARADRRSFGFRKFRGCQDAGQQIFITLSGKTKAEWILEGDIKGCFDNISHVWLLENIPMEKKVLKEFLKSGYVYNRKLFPTEEGSSQGGIISPILAKLIRALNPKILGWCNYHKSMVSKQKFQQLDAVIFKALWKWARSRHPMKSRQWIKDRYWKRIGNRDWIFMSENQRLIFASSIKIKRHIMTKLDMNPYLKEDVQYLKNRNSVLCYS